MKSWSLALVSGAAFAAAIVAPSALAGISYGYDAWTSDTVPMPAALRVNSNAARNTFVALLSSPRTISLETSEGYISNPTFPAPASGPGVNPTLNFGLGVTATVTGGIIRFQTPGTAGPETGPDGRYATDGGDYLSQFSNDLVIQFNTAQHAFGFYGIDIGDFGSTLTITLSGVGATQQIMVLPPKSASGETTGSVMFWSYSDPNFAFTKVTLNDNNIGDVFAYDQFTIGTPIVPAPAGAMVLPIAALLGGRRRR